jgi:hypothetical protein
MAARAASSYALKCPMAQSIACASGALIFVVRPRALSAAAAARMMRACAGLSKRQPSCDPFAFH